MGDVSRSHLTHGFECLLRYNASSAESRIARREALTTLSDTAAVVQVFTPNVETIVTNTLLRVPCVGEVAIAL